jgi:protein-S-isoprenylcysteine O-methyltransferase Ste14
METSAFVVLCINFLYIALLPVIFFNKGSGNKLWFLTGGSFFISPIFFIAMFAGILQPLPVVEYSYYWIAPIVGTILSVTSIGLMSLTIGTHRIPLALWHQNDDAPTNIVTWGAYRRIRHPFYTSFILAQLGCVLIAPHIGTIAMLIYAVSILTYTAAKEEKKLSASAFGDEYQAYIKVTGRFFP